MMKSPVITRSLLIFALLGGVLILAALETRAPAELPVNRPLSRVHVAEIQEIIWEPNLTFSGVTRSAQRSFLSFTQGGRLVKRPVRIGETVTTGQLLAQIDSEPYQHTADAAIASLNEINVRLIQLEKDLDRTRRLYEVSAATEEEFEKLSSAVRSLQSARDAALSRRNEAIRQLNETELRAPFDGTLTKIFSEPGEVIMPGKPLLMISGLGGYEIEIEVPESAVSHIQRGDTVLVTLPFSSLEPFQGKVSSVGAASLGPGQLFPVLISLDNSPGLHAGLTARIRITLNNQLTRHTVPLKSIVNPGGGHPALFIVRNNQAHRIEVTVEGLIGDRVVITGPVKAKDPVIVAGHTSLLDKQRVEVAK